MDEIAFIVRATSFDESEGEYDTEFHEAFATKDLAEAVLEQGKRLITDWDWTVTQGDWQGIVYYSDPGFVLEHNLHANVRPDSVERGNKDSLNLHVGGSERALEALRRSEHPECSLIVASNWDERDGNKIPSIYVGVTSPDLEKAELELVRLIQAAQEKLATDYVIEEKSVIRYRTLELSGPQEFLLGPLPFAAARLFRAGLEHGRATGRQADYNEPQLTKLGAMMVVSVVNERLEVQDEGEHWRLSFNADDSSRVAGRVMLDRLRGAGIPFQSVR